MKALQKLRAALALVTLLSSAGLVNAQEPKHPPRPSELDQKQDAQAEIEELFAKVERNLREIDRILFDAAAGDLSLERPEESGIADLLRQTQKSSQSTINDIDRILEISKNSKSQSQNSPEPSDSPPEPGGSPLDQPRDQTPQEQEQTPEAPADQQEQPEPIDTGQEQPTESENSEGDPLDPAAPVSPKDVVQDGERWGELPPRVREVFRSQGGGDLPTEYRDWIDSYYRRLNKRP